MTLAETNTKRVSEWALSVLPAHGDRRPRARALHAQILEHTRLGDRYMSLVLSAPDIARSARAGQFVMITVARPGQNTPTLPRPMAIYSRNPRVGTIEILYGVVGEGTRALSAVGAGEELVVVGPLGRPFDVAAQSSAVMLIGRGIGTCSLTTVAQDNQRNATRTIAVTSARTPQAVVGVEFYRNHGAIVHAVNDEDGTSAPATLMARLVHDHDGDPPDQIVVCGSNRLLEMAQELSERWTAPIQVSVEAHMACGLGYCHGCASGARDTSAESPLVCSDGPAFAWQRTRHL